MVHINFAVIYFVICTCTNEVKKKIQIMSRTKKKGHGQIQQQDKLDKQAKRVYESNLCLNSNNSNLGLSFWTNRDFQIATSNPSDKTVYLLQ